MSNKHIIFVGDVTPYLGNLAKERHPEAFLVESNNYVDILDSEKELVFYTSLGDLPNEIVLWNLLLTAKHVIYCPPEDGIWSDGKQLNKENIFESLQGLTEYIIQKISKEFIEVTGFQSRANPVFVTTEEQRRSKNSQVWVAGCSMSAGYLINPNERFGFLVAQELGMEASFLAKPKSSIRWSADQILRSDIRENDIVLWGLTLVQRFPLWDKKTNNIEHIKIRPVLEYDNTYFTTDEILQQIGNPSLLYDAIISVHQVVNFCRKIGAKLLIVGLLSHTDVEFELDSVPEFIQYHNDGDPNPVHNMIDLASDNRHPGPEQNKMYAKFCISKLKQLYKNL